MDGAHPKQSIFLMEALCSQPRMANYREKSRPRTQNTASRPRGQWPHRLDKRFGDELHIQNKTLPRRQLSPCSSGTPCWSRLYPWQPTINQQWARVIVTNVTKLQSQTVGRRKDTRTIHYQ